MLRIDGERKRQGRLRLRVARGQSWDQNASSDTYIYISRKIVPAVRLGRLAALANKRGSREEMDKTRKETTEETREETEKGLRVGLVQVLS